MKEILNYYGFNSIEEAEKAHGLSAKDEERLLKEMYEEDTAPCQI